MRVNFSADYWTHWWVNGREVYSTMRHGNNTPPEPKPDLAPSRLAHSFLAPVRRGRNLIVLRLVGGSGYGCRIAMEAAAGQPGNEGHTSATQLTSIYHGPLLLAYDMALNGGYDVWRPGFEVESLRLATPPSTDFSRTTPLRTVRFAERP